MLLKGEKLHRVFHQTWTGGEARPRDTVHAGVSAFHLRQQLRVIQAGALDHHVELVSSGELHVAKCVADELGELCFQRLQFHHFRRDFAENLFRRSQRFGGGRAN